MFDKEQILNLRNGLNGQRTVIEAGESLVVEGTFVDGNGAAILEANIATFELTLYDEDSATIINSRNAVDIKDANNGVVDTAGTFSFRLDPDDAVIINTNKEVGDLESHIIKLVWTWNDGTADLTGIHETRIFVKKIATPA